MDKIEDLINDILHSINFDHAKIWGNSLIAKNILSSGTCSLEDWNKLLSTYHITKYDVAKSALKLAYIHEDTNNATIDSLKAEIYDIGKDRNPSPKHIQALFYLISYKQSFQVAYSLRFCYEVLKVFTFTQTLQNLVGEDKMILYSESNAKAILLNLDISTLQTLHNSFVSNKWTEVEDDYNDEDYLTNYLANMDYNNFSFLYHNVDCLCDYYDIFEFMLNQLVRSNPEKLEYEYEILKKKRITSKLGNCYSALMALKYELSCEPVTKDMIDEIELYLSDFQNIESLIFNVGKLTPLIWNSLLLLLSNYEANPKGKKVRDWLNKVQYY